LKAKRRRMNPSLKSPRKRILPNGRNNNKRRRLPYKQNFNNNQRSSERLMMEILRLSRTSFFTKRTKNLPNQLPPKIKRPRKKLKRRRLSPLMKFSQFSQHPRLHPVVMPLEADSAEVEADSVEVEEEEEEEARDHLDVRPSHINTTITNTREKLWISLMIHLFLL